MKMTFLLLAVVWTALAMAESTPSFQAAQPVWPTALVAEMNTLVRFSADYKGTAPAVLRIAASNPYRIRLNGKYVGYGPARGPKGWFRIDEWPLVGTVNNRIEIDVAGYNAASYYFMNQPPFVEAEVCSGTRVLAATARDGGFTAKLTDRVQKTIRYSGQRLFTEVYRVGGGAEKGALELCECPAVRHLPRLAPYPDFRLNGNVRIVSRSRAVVDKARKVRQNRFSDWEPGKDKRTAFPKGEIEVNSWADAEQIAFSGCHSENVPVGKKVLLDHESVLVDAALNDCGFPGMTVDVKDPGRIVFLFDEVLTTGRVDYARLSCVNVIEWIFESPGRYEIESFEPYVFRYAEIAVPDGAMEISDLHVRSYKNPDVKRASFCSSDPALNKIFAAAKETFAQNAVDVFTDCPSRERAGWLCDSYFIGRVNRLLCGNTMQEKLFLQNYLLPEKFDCLPQGMVPMCYPGDHPTGNFIPNWAMWLVLEAEEYLARGGDRELIDALKSRIFALVDFFWAFRNSDGLLERLPRWIFVEWSRSNNLVRDVNYPSNMLWAEMLDAVDRLYGRPDLGEEAKRVRDAVRLQSWTGKWFCDNARRQSDGSLKISGECTETCQYYAFYFHTATAETYPELWRTLRDDFGPQRKQTKKHPEIWPSNAFIGNYLRLELLSRAGLVQKIMDETKGYFLGMAEKTGTLWEHDDVRASCCHGFASHVAVLLFRDVLGVRGVDAKLRRATVVPPKGVDLDWCSGVFPVSDEETVRVSWRNAGKPVVDWNCAEGSDGRELNSSKDNGQVSYQ